MGFLSGRVTYQKFRLETPATGKFSWQQGDLSFIENHAAGQQRVAAADGVEVGWAAGKHVLDTTFTLEKNVLGNVLHLALRVDQDKLPADLLNAHYELNLTALSAHNPSGLASAKQKREARELARDDVEGLAKDGRFKKRKLTPVLWDAAAGDVLFGATAYPAQDRFCSLFQQTFGVAMVPVTADRSDDLIGAAVAHAPFVEPKWNNVPAWIADDTSRAWLGNEFLLWLWFNSEGDCETVKAADGSDITYMIARHLLLDCPRGQLGSDVFRHEGPSRLPEAKRAAQAGKLPRKCGLTLVRHVQQYELTIQAETLAVSSAKLPAIDGEGLDATGRRFARVGQVQHLVETVDLLYGHFLALRASGEWADTHARMCKWLAR